MLRKIGSRVSVLRIYEARGGNCGCGEIIIFFFKKRLRTASRKVRPSLSAGSASSGLSSAGEEDRDPPAERGLELIFSLAEEEEKEKEEEEGQRAWWVGREGGVAQWALRGVVEQTLPDCAKAGREYKEEPKKKEKRVKKESPPPPPPCVPVPRACDGGLTYNWREKEEEVGTNGTDRQSPPTTHGALSYATFPPFFFLKKGTLQYTHTQVKLGVVCIAPPPNRAAKNKRPKDQLHLFLPFKLQGAYEECVYSHCVCVCVWFHNDDDHRRHQR